jgi:hypothetical protein
MIEAILESLLKNWMNWFCFMVWHETTGEEEQKQNFSEDES